jgi:hypothetical protein
LDRIGEILDLLGHGDSDNRCGDDLGIGLAADLCKKVLASVGKTSGFGKFRTVVLKSSVVSDGN